jgi:HK97 family phage major capsid protein
MSTQLIKQELDNLQKLCHDFKEEVKATTGEQIRDYGAEANIKFEKMNDALDKATTKLESLEKAAKRPVFSFSEKDIEAKAEKKLFSCYNDFIKKGDGSEYSKICEGGAKFNFKAAKDLIAKDLSVGSDVDGGFLVNDTFGGVVETKVFETSAVRQVASSITVGNNGYEFVRDEDEPGSGWTGEGSAITGTTSPQFGAETILAHELYAEPKATRTFLDDAEVDAAGWLQRKLIEKFTRDENNAFVVGDGVAKPRGMTTYAAGTDITLNQVQQVDSGANGSVTHDGLVDLFSSLKSDYEDNAVFAVNRLLLGEIRKLKDSQGMPIYGSAIGVDGTFNQNVLGYNLVKFEDLATPATNSLSGVFADFKRAYQVVDRRGIDIVRDPFTSKPFIKFYATKRTGGDVVNFEALKILKLAA